MTHARILLAASVVAFAAPAAAQLANRSIAVESGASLPFARGAGADAAFALSATTWLDGAAEAVARLASSSAVGTGGRGSARALCGTIGVRLSLLPDPLRPQLTVEAGWARLEREGFAGDAVAFGAGAGLEWFAARDVSIAARAALRGVGSALGAELTLAAAAYF